MNEKVLPTITLARLYESQKQLIHALVVYKSINGLEHSEDLILKIEELKDAIFSGNSSDYPDSVKLLFSIKERKHLNILPHNQVLTYNDAIARYHSDPTAQIELPLQEDIPETDSQDQKIIKEILSFMDTLKSTELSDINKITSDKKLQDLTLGEIKKILQEITEKKKIHLDLNLKEAKTIL